MSKLGFLLGAGASFPFGIPMMREFFERFCDYISHNRAHCLPLLQQLTSDAPGAADLEFLIQQLEQVRAIRGGLAVLGQPVNGISNQLVLADELRGYLDMFLIETCENFNQPKVQTLLSQFVQLAMDRDAYIFTTNYDRLIEVAAKSIDINCADGFELASSRPESHWNGEFANGIRLVKLHGSVNWYEEEGSDNLYRLERGYSLPSHEYRLTHGERALRPLLIIPTLEKAILKRPYASLLTQFSDALKELDVLVIIGSSLRDEHLRNTIIERAKDLDIILINPGAAGQTNIVRNPDRTYALSVGIEELINYGLSALAGLLDKLDALPAADAISRRNLIDAVMAEVSATVKRSLDLGEVVRDKIARIGSQDMDVRLGAIRSVTAPVHPEVIQVLRRVATSQDDESVRVAAIDALAEMEGVAATDVLAHIACASGDPLLVRAEAALALKSFVGRGLADDEYRRVVGSVESEVPMAALFRAPIAEESPTKPKGPQVQ